MKKTFSDTPGRSNMRQKSFRMCASRCSRYATGTGSLFNRSNLTIFVLFLSLLPSNDAAPTLKSDSQSPRTTESEPLPTKITESSTIRTIDGNKIADKFVSLSNGFTNSPQGEHDGSHVGPPVSLPNGNVIENRYTVVADDTITTTLETIPRASTAGDNNKIENDMRTNSIASKSLPRVATTFASAAPLVHDAVNQNDVNKTTESSFSWPSASGEPNSVPDLTMPTTPPLESSSGLSMETVQPIGMVRPILSQSETPTTLNVDGGTSTPTSLMEIDVSFATMTVPLPTKLKFPLNADDYNIDDADNDDTIRTKSTSMGMPATVIQTDSPSDAESDRDQSEHQSDAQSTTNASIRKTLDVISSTMATVKSHRIGEFIKSSDVQKVTEKHKHDMTEIVAATAATLSKHNNKKTNHQSDGNKENSKEELSNENGDTEPTNKQPIEFAPDSSSVSSLSASSSPVARAEKNQTNSDDDELAASTTMKTVADTTTTAKATSTVSESLFNLGPSTIGGSEGDGDESSASDKSHNDSWRISTMSSSTPSSVNITALVINNTISVASVTPSTVRVDDEKIVEATVRQSNAMEIANDTGKLNAAVEQESVPTSEIEIDRIRMLPPKRLNATAPVSPRNGAILDYDKSSEEIFDIEHETSTVRTTKMASSTREVLLAKIKPYEMDSDELFLPADEFDPSDGVTATSSSTRATEPTPTPTTSFSTEASTTTQTKESTVERDSDTIFYISNTEVKVVESSMPTPNTKQENQFFPALYEEDVLIDFHSKNISGWNGVSSGGGGGASNSAPVEKYEEDIILSPMKNNFDPTKINHDADDDDTMNLGYVGESFIDVKDGDDDGAGGGDSPISSNVIIEPAVIPDVQSQSIGVPIIGELPPQIDLQDLQDYKTDTMQLNQTENTITSHLLQRVGDNLQKMQQLSAELPKINGGNSGEAIANIAADIVDEKIQVKPIELAQTPFSSSAPSIELHELKLESELLEQQLKNGTQTQGKNATAEAITNVTAHTVLDDEPEHSKFVVQIQVNYYLQCVRVFELRFLVLSRNRIYVFFCLFDI